MTQIKGKVLFLLLVLIILSSIAFVCIPRVSEIVLPLAQKTFLRHVLPFKILPDKYNLKLSYGKPGIKNQVKLNKIFRFAFVFPPPKTGQQTTRESNDISGLRHSLFVAGVRPDEIAADSLTIEKLQYYDVIVIPFASSKYLSEDEIETIKTALNSGVNIIFDGESTLSKELGIKLYQTPLDVQDIMYLDFPLIPLSWNQADSIKPVRISAKQRIIYCETNSKLPIAVKGKFGKGFYIYFSSLFSPDTDKGYSRFPFLLESIISEFGYKPTAERKKTAVYYDPGNRDKMTIEKLVILWRGRGVRSVYAGGWYFEGDYTFDYEKLIRECHKNGILVYCWLELPMVSRKFWDDHPEWREKTATLKDAMIDWRFLMNLSDPKCRKEIFNYTKLFLEKYDWDGINFAELYFESANGPADAEHFTPMNDNVRNNFKKAYGFDPLEIFNPAGSHYWKNNIKDWLKLADYRKRLNNELKNHLLKTASAVKKVKGDFEIVVTAIDASMMPGLEDYISEDTQYLLCLQKKYNLTLQIEDEWMFWYGRPDRYETLGKYYRKFIRNPSQLEIDFNVVDCHTEGFGGFPSEIPTGEELRQVVYNIGLSRARPAFYAEDTIYSHDYKNISTVLGREAVVTWKSQRIWETDSPYAFTLNTGAADNIKVFIDDKQWAAGENETVIVPAGKHTVRFEQTLENTDNLKLYYLSGELIKATFNKDVLEFVYTEGMSPCYAVINKKPFQISVDGHPSNCTVYENSERFSIKLPGGKHKVRIVGK